MQLFRQQALDHQSRLHGEVFQVRPVGWSSILGLVGMLVLAVLLFLTLGSRTVTARTHGIVVARPDGTLAAELVPVAGLSRPDVTRTVLLTAQDRSVGIVEVRILPQQTARGQWSVSLGTGGSGLRAGMAVDAVIERGTDNIAGLLRTSHDR